MKEKEFRLVARTEGGSPRIDVIKALREVSGCGLRDAKYLVDLAYEFYELTHEEVIEGGFPFTEFVLTCKATRNLMVEVDKIQSEQHIIASQAIRLASGALRNQQTIVDQAIDENLDQRVSHPIQIIRMADHLVRNLHKGYVT